MLSPVVCCGGFRIALKLSCGVGEVSLRLVQLANVVLEGDAGEAWGEGTEFSG